jgi:hypothetical protein
MIHKKADATTTCIHLYRVWTLMIYELTKTIQTHILIHHASVNDRVAKSSRFIAFLFQRLHLPIQRGTFRPRERQYNPNLESQLCSEEW